MLRGAASTTRNGGFGGAPKFPPTPCSPFLLRMHVRTGSAEALRMAVLTLDRMADGGIYDQLGGGFHRYAVDAHLARAALREDALRQRAAGARVPAGVRGDGRRRASARWRSRRSDYLLRDLLLEHGGFASAQDADTEGEEGTTYVWTPAQLEEALPRRARGGRLGACWGVSAEGNFEGATVLSRVSRPGRGRRRPRDASRTVRARLLEARADRVRSPRSTTRRWRRGTAWR